MSETGEEVTTPAVQEHPFRDLHFGRIYDKLLPNQPIDIAVLGKITIEIDEENLGLEKVNLDNLQKGWERDREGFTKHCAELGIPLDPFTVYKYYQIQRKAFQVLGKPIENQALRTQRQRELGDKCKLSKMKGVAMCSEYAILSTYIAQKIGEPAHLIVGTVLTGDEQWREAHAYGWVDGINAVFDSVQAQSDGEYPAMMMPTNPATLRTLEDGIDIEAKRIGSTTTATYGLEAGGFGATLSPKKSAPNEQPTAE
ncbi:MAG: hypothetical protein M1444_03150 [Patescibacteria group bacterium]|nr:hypothetical protein [Patescibacteria group bacterium]MCL6096648.1 hypothetical protein [Patescibacteria group bacterium]